MTELRLTLLLGPRETVEAAELAMPELPHVLAAAFPLDGWDADEVERLLMLAGGAFRQSIAERRHEEPPPKAAVLPSPPALVRDEWGDRTPAEALTIHAAAPIGSLRMEVAQAIEPEAWAAIDASLRKADEVLAVIERRRAA